jgi:hypothetical protein
MASYKTIKNKKGAALITVYMAVAILLAFGGYVVDVSNQQNSAANTFKKQEQAISIAEAGLDRALVWLRLQGTPPQGGIASITQNLPPTGPSQGSYTVSFTDLGVPAGSTAIRRYRVSSTGTVGATTQTVTTYFQPDNYARYIWFTDTESYQGTNVWFWDQDSLNGPTHTNGHFNIKGNPVFQGEVRSVDDYLRYLNNGNNINSDNLSNPPYDQPDFQDTVTLGADPIRMPTQALNLRTASTNGGIRYSGDTTVRLNSTGTMNVTNSGHTYNNIALPGNGALFVNNGNLRISGTLSGRLTVGASKDIIITNNILYASDPRLPGSTSTDTLGIISEGDVVIDDNASAGNLEIDASIMALNTSFMLEDWWTGGARGTLTVFGGIIQKQRGPVGTFSGNTKVSGYSKNYRYDARLLSSPPPFVPTTGDYIPLSWENN